MRNIVFISLVLALVFMQCSPKVVNAPAEDKAPMVAKEDFRNNPPAAGPAPKIEIGSYETFKLDNGLQVIVVENRKIPRVSFSLTIDRDPIFEGENAGYTNLAGQLLNKGTTTRSKAEIDEAVDFIGGQLSTSSTNIFASSLKRHSDKLLELMSDVLLNPTFPEEEFDKVKKQTISGLQTEKDNPDAISRKVGGVLSYGATHPYGETATERTVEKVTVDMCKEYYKSFFKPNISYLVIVGDTNLDEAKATAQKYFGSWKKGDVQKMEFPKPTPPESTKVAFVNRPGAVQSVVNINYAIDIIPGSGDAIKASVMNTLLGGFFKSRINENLREDKAYTYGARTALTTSDVIGQFRAYGSVRNAVSDSSITEFLYEMRRLRQEAVPEDELSLVKNYMSGNFALALERPETVARYALNTFRYNLPPDYYATYLEKLSKVNVNDIQSMAVKYIHPNHANILIVGNKSEVAESLRKFSSGGEIDFYDVEGNYMEPIGGDADAIDPASVLTDYYNAIGGLDKIQGVTSITQEMGGEVMGQQMTMKVLKEAPGKIAIVQSMMGMVMSKQVFDGENGYVEAQGQKIDFDEAAKKEMMKEAGIFPDAVWDSEGYTLTFSGLENINGKPAYTLEVKDPEGSTTIVYIDKESKLKVKDVKTSEQMGQTITATTEYSDYREVNGIQFPYSLSITGVAPFPLKFDVKDIEINTDIDDSNFQ